MHLVASVLLNIEYSLVECFLNCRSCNLLYHKGTHKAFFVALNSYITGQCASMENVQKVVPWCISNFMNLLQVRWGREEMGHKLPSAFWTNWKCWVNYPTPIISQQWLVSGVSRWIAHYALTFPLPFTLGSFYLSSTKTSFLPLHSHIQGCISYFLLYKWRMKYPFICFTYSYLLFCKCFQSSYFWVNCKTFQIILVEFSFWFELIYAWWYVLCRI